MYNPIEEGFSERSCAIDRCQLWLLRTLALRYGDRLYLKGGLAMRALFGSLRLTKDIDFERAPSLSNESLRKSIKSALQAAALGAGLAEPVIAITKDTRTTLRAALAARLRAGGETVQYEVEVSGRGLPPAPHLTHAEVTPPAAYRMTRFSVASFDMHAMAASKVMALHADHRSVPRDVFDLADLIAYGANPAALLAQGGKKLRAAAGSTIERTAAIGWERAKTELLPYLPQSVRQSLNAGEWDALCLHVADTVDAWLKEAA